MKTTEEKIAIMQAYVDGKQIEIDSKINGTWKVINFEPNWNWGYSDYRIKREPKYRPFKDAEEVMAAIKEHGDLLKGMADDVKGTYYHILSVSNNGIDTYACSLSYDFALEYFVFADGTPFGKLEE